MLRFSNVSGQHCQLSLENGYWFVQDMNSQNGTKVNGSRIVRKRLDPGDLLAVAKQKYTINYSPSDNGATGPPPSDEEELQQVLSRSLLDTAGLQRKPEYGQRRYNPTDDSAGQMKRREYSSLPDANSTCASRFEFVASLNSLELVHDC